MSLGLPKLAQDTVMVQTTGVRRVGMLRHVHKAFAALDAKDKAKLERRFEHYGIPGTTMPKEHFNSEGRYSTGGRRPQNVLVCAFKSYQTRLYGVVVSLHGVETFIGSRLITDKKRDRADQGLLRQVAQDFRPYLGE